MKNSGCRLAPSKRISTFQPGRRVALLISRKIFHYLLLHRAFDAARRITQTIPLDTSTPRAVGSSPSLCHKPFCILPQRPTRNVTFLLEGPLFEHSSLRCTRPRNSRRVAPRLRIRSLRLEPTAPSAHPPRLLSNGQALEPFALSALKNLGLTIVTNGLPISERPSSQKLHFQRMATLRIWIEPCRQRRRAPVIQFCRRRFVRWAFTMPTCRYSEWLDCRHLQST